VSATDPAQAFSPTLPLTPHSIPPAQPSMKKAIAGIGLLLLLGGGLLFLAAGAVLAALFVDFDSLLGQNPSVAAADAGATGSTTGSNPVAAADAGALPSSDTAATATASPGKKPLPATTGTTTAAAKTKSGATFGQACVSNADCKGAYERCGQARVCECSTLGGWNQPRACGSRCVANTDPENCGACGKRCANDEICTTSGGGSTEHPICIPCAKAGLASSPKLLCGPHKCVAPNSDPRNCGGCNKKCALGQSCVNGACE
jgi:hypothetical protein